MIRFGNGNTATACLDAVEVSGAVSCAGLSSGRAVLLVCGGADDLAEAAYDRACDVLGPAIAQAGGAAGAVVVDGGTASGVMRITGLARVQDPDAVPVLVGVAPAGKVTYPGGPENAGLAALQEDHSHFLLAASSEWGDETTLMMAAAQVIAGGAPVAMALAGGGSVAGSEVLAAVRRSWPVFIVPGTGGLADQLERLWATYRVPSPRRLAFLLPERFRYRALPTAAAITEPDLREIITRGDLRVTVDSRAADLGRRLAWELQDKPVVKQAWQDFATYDRLAARLRKTFAIAQGTILTLGITATLLALIYNQARGSTLHWAVVATPLTASVLYALASRNATGQRWVMLRAAAEAIKSEIYRHRATGSARTSTNAEITGMTSQEVLAARLATVTEKLMQTQASSGPLTPYHGPLPPHMYGASNTDDGISTLDPAGYLRIRVKDQLTYYHGKIRALSRKRTRLQILAVASGAAGTILAAAGLEVWVGLTSGTAAAALAYLGYLQVDNTIVSYNQAASALDTLQSRWHARIPQNRTPEAFSDLVSHAETVLTTELSGWVQQMNDTLRELTARQNDATSTASDDSDKIDDQG